MANIKYINGNPIVATAVELADGSLSGAALTDGSVGGAKIADGSIVSGKIADKAVTNGKIADGAVTTAKIADGSVTLSKLNISDTNLGGATFTMPHTMVWAYASFRNGGYTGADNRCAAASLVLKDTLVVTPSSGLQVSFYVGDDLGTFVAWTTEPCVIPANTRFVTNFAYSDNRAVDGPAVVDGVTFSTSDWGYKEFLNDYYVRLDKTERLEPYSAATTDYVRTIPKSLHADGEMVGFRNFSAGTTVSSSIAPHYSDSDLMLLIGAGTSAAMRVFMDGESTVYNQGSIVTIPAGKEFSYTLYPRGHEKSVIVAPKGTEGNTGNNKLSSMTRYRVDCAFMTDSNTIFMVNRLNQTYIVVRNGEIISNAADIDGPIGHANSCNYVGGKVYISDWTDKTLVHVFAVNTESLTMTYERDITIPIDDNILTASDCFVLDSGERQILAMGFRFTYVRETNETNNLLTVQMWNKAGETYVKSWEKCYPSPTELQGMTYVDGCIYYLANNLSYDHVCITRLDLRTGEATNGTLATGTLASRESEAIIHLTGNVFIIVDSFSDYYSSAFVARQ